jgi:hypothetical protein
LLLLPLTTAGKQQQNHSGDAANGSSYDDFALLGRNGGGMNG